MLSGTAQGRTEEAAARTALESFGPPTQPACYSFPVVLGIAPIAGAGEWRVGRGARANAVLAR